MRGLATIAAAVLASLSFAGEVAGQPGDRPIRVGIFTPSVEFADSSARLSYIRTLASAIERAIGRDVEGLSFTSLRSLRAARLDVAVVDAPCAVANRWPVLASGRVGKSASRTWALYAREARNLSDLRGKRLVTVKSGCDDRRFVANALFESEVPLGYFGAWAGKPDVKAAVAEVATLRGADAVFAPVGSGRGLRRLFAAAAIPGPALVQINGGLDGATATSIGRAVAAFGGRGPISGYAAGGGGSYTVLRRRMAGSTRRGVFADAPPVRFSPADVIADSAVPKDTELAPIDDLFETPPDRL